MGSNGSNKETLSCFYTNANSLRNKKDEFLNRLDKKRPDIVGVTEVWQKEDVHIQGYQVAASKTRPEGARGGGVVLLVNEEIKVDECEALNSAKFQESVWCVLHISSTCKLLVGVCYHPPNSLKENNEELLRLMDLLKAVHVTDYLIMGDFNYREIGQLVLLKARQTPTHLSFFNKVQDCFLCQHVPFHTRYRDGVSPSTLDLVFTDQENNVEELDCGAPLGKSDHCVITWELRIGSQNHMTCKGSHPFNYKAGDYDAINEELSKTQWDVMKDMHTQEAWAYFREKVQKYRDKYVPRFKAKKKLKCSPPWWNKELESQVKKKYQMYKTYRSHQSRENYKRYARIRNETLILLRKTRQRYENELMKLSKKTPKKLAKYIRKQSKTKDRVSPLVRQDGSVTKTDGEIAQELQAFFCSVFVQEGDEELPEFADRVQEANVLYEIKVTEEHVQEELQSLNEEKAPGPDDMSPYLLKKCAKQLAYPLMLIFVKSLEEGQLPEQWKRASVVPIFKAGSKKSPNNYRPVSLTSQVCKVLERIIKKHVTKHLLDNNLITDEQHGFVPRKSCLTNLLESLEDWTHVLDDKESLDIIYCDFKKAFDSVPHQRLLKKISAYGIRGQILNWIRDFLADRKQEVVVRGVRSSLETVTSGVPQGSVLGPTLFNLYVNELPELVQSQIKLFADDAKVYQKISTQEDFEILQSDINHLCDWSECWLLDFNTQKCKVMHCGSGNPRMDYHMRGQVLQTTDAERDLGVTVTSDLKPSTHCQRAANRAMMALRLLRNAFDSLTVQNFKGLFSTYVRPHLDYCVQAVGPQAAKDIELLEKVQQRATKLVREVRHLPYPERLSRLEVPSIKKRLQRGDMIETYKILTGKVNVRREKFFSLRRTHTRGHHLKIDKKRVTHQARLRFFSQRVVNSWNSLPSEVVSANTIQAFKAKLDKHLQLP